MMESDDSIEINHVTFHKPFVEKPINAEDHNVYIYFPTSAGGGSQRLFRKVNKQWHADLTYNSYQGSQFQTEQPEIYSTQLAT